MITERYLRYYNCRFFFEIRSSEIALPKLYKHRPLYNVALYHELGHFVDESIGITAYSLLLHPSSPSHEEIEKRHRMEFFADLFAANYVGLANCLLLSHIADNAPASPTHPATAQRNAVVSEFLNGVNNPIVDLFGACLSALNAPELRIRFIIPDLSETFNNIRPYNITNEPELHGLIQAAWVFLEHALEKKKEPWIKLEEQEIGRIINDLTEKSIRNKAIQDKWNEATR